MGNLILVTGGARSGKSSFAELLTASFGKEVVYLATAQALDTEMEQRIEHHRQTRPAEWTTLEEPIEVPKAVAQLAGQDRVVLLDCVTLWLTNLMLQEMDRNNEDDIELEKALKAKVSELVEVVKQQAITLVCVTNEVGYGVVPDNHMARVYRDIAGRANQMLGKAAERVYLVTCGYPVEIKQQGSKLLQELGGKG